MARAASQRDRTATTVATELFIQANSSPIGGDSMSSGEVIGEVTLYLGNATYAALALIALWGTFSAIMLLRRISRSRFRTEQEQDAFLDRVDESLGSGSFEGVAELCRGDPRAVPQLIQLAIANRSIGFSKVRALVAERFQRDFLSDLEYRLSWVYTVIRTAPMLGLLGTVAGMMSAFSQLATRKQVSPEDLAGDISLALITTIIGLCIAIPLMITAAGITVRMRKLEDLVGAGLTRFMDALKQVMTSGARRRM